MSEFVTYYADRVFQDYGHTGYLHPAEYSIDKHFGMFIFDFTGVHEYYSFYRFVFTVKEFYYTFQADDFLLGKFVLGTFYHPENLASCRFLTQEDLDFVGFVPLSGRTSTGVAFDLEKRVHKKDLASGKLTLDFIFKEKELYLGLLFVPENLNSYSEQGLYELRFYDYTPVPEWKPSIFAQPLFLIKTSADGGDGSDAQHPFTMQLPNNVDPAFSYEKMKYTAMFGKQDHGDLQESGARPKIHGSDYSKNLSMQIQHINLVDSGTVLEIYGFTGFISRTYYERRVKGYDFASVKKLNFVTWSGILVEWPWCSLLWYGEIYYFADLEEFGECCRKFFREYEDSLCPICGETLGGQLKYSFVDLLRIPHQLYFCSLDCLHAFNSRLMQYRNRLTKPDHTYYTGITGKKYKNGKVDDSLSSAN